MLEFVEPAAVVCHIPAAEKGRVVVSRLVHHRDDNLSLYIYAVEVVPVVFRGIYAEAAENDFGGWNLHFVCSPGRPDHHIFLVQEFCLLFALYAELAPYRTAGCGYHLERLEIAVAKERLQAERPELVRHIVDSLLLIRRHWLASAKLV